MLCIDGSLLAVGLKFVLRCSCLVVGIDILEALDRSARHGIDKVRDLQYRVISGSSVDDRLLHESL